MQWLFRGVLPSEYVGDVVTFLFPSGGGGDQDSENSIKPLFAPPTVVSYLNHSLNSITPVRVTSTIIWVTPTIIWVTPTIIWVTPHHYMGHPPPLYGSPPPLYGSTPPLFGSPPPLYASPPPLHGLHHQDRSHQDRQALRQAMIPTDPEYIRGIKTTISWGQGWRQEWQHYWIFHHWDIAATRIRW